VRRAKRSLRGCDAIGIAVGKIIDHYKMAKHFDITITDDDLIIERRSQPIDDEALLDGFYVVRTNVKAELLDSSSVVGAYKGLSNVERAFRSLKTVDIEIRPIHHRRGRRVRAHVLVCSSDCSWFGRIADGRRHDLRRLGVRTAVSLDDIRSRRDAIVPAMPVAA
jgi:transposase